MDTHKDGHVATAEHEKECIGETLTILHKIIALYVCPAGAFLWSELGSGLGNCRTLTRVLCIKENQEQHWVFQEIYNTFRNFLVHPVE